MSKNESGGESGGQGGDSSKKDADVFENRGTKKIIRLITVVAYLFSVSFVAIVLSAYYLFLWEPPNPRLIQRARLRADPQIQFLMSDPPHSRDAFPRGPFNDTTFDRKGFNRSYKSIMMRIADEISPDEDFGNNDIEDRNKLNESLSMLRNSLVEFLRREYNHSHVQRGNKSRSDAAEGESVMGGKYAKSWSDLRPESTKAGNDISAKEDRVFEKGAFVTAYENSTDAGDDSGPPLALKSTTISGDEANKDDFTIETGRATHESLRSIDRTGYNLKGSTDVRRKTSRDGLVPDNLNKETGNRNSTERNAIVGKENQRYSVDDSTAQIRTVTESTNGDSYDEEAAKDKSTTPSKQTFKDRSIPNNVNKKYKIQDMLSFKVTGSKVERSGYDVNPRDIASPYSSYRYPKYSSKNDFLTSNGPGVDLPHSLGSTKRLEFPRPTGGPVVASAGDYADPKGTKVGRMTTRPTAVTKEVSPAPTMSTQRVKDFLTILMETTDAGEVSSSVSPTSYENFRIDPSSTTEDHAEKTS